MTKELQLEKDRETMDSRQILRMTQIGLWRVEVEPGRAPRLFADEVMDALIGVEEPMTPEERHAFQLAHVHPEDRELFAEYSNRLAHQHTEIVYRYLHPVQGEMFVRCAGARNEGVRDCVAIVGTHQNISGTTRLEQGKQAERRLAQMNSALLQEQAQQEDYYRELLDLQSCAVMAYAIPGYRLLHMNKEALRIFDTESMEQAQQNLRGVISAICYPEQDTKEKLKSLRDVDGSLNYEAIVFQGQPNECHIMATTKVLHDGQGDRVVVTTFLDVSEINLLRNALLAAQHANQAKTMFLNNMSHDIRTPMNAIIGFTSLAASHLDNPQRVKEYLQKISVSSEHLLSLINDVLDMSRIESGKVKIDQQPLHLPDLMHDIRTIVQPTIASKQLDFVIDTVDVRDENIVADKLRLNQILLNILSNGVKFNKTGGMVSLRIKQLPHAPAGCASYQFIIRDTGIGMKEDFVSQIFDAFAREETATVSGIPGTGLGMAITKNIVDMMGGTIRVKSQLGIGTEFTVSLTFPLSGEPAVYEKIDQLQGLRVLVADDDTDTCLNIASMLSDIGMRSEWTTSGREAVVRAKYAYETGNEFAAYIIDWLMPDMNGIETVRRIRRVIGEGKPIIILTAYDWADVEEEAREAGVTAFCEKPLFMSELRDILSQPFRQARPCSTEAIDFSGKRVLLVEDNQLNQEIAVTILEETGLTVETADDGTVAVEKMKHAVPGQYDLILMDIQMPFMDGYEATRRIRELEDPALASVPIIAMTANAFSSDQEMALASGMDGYLTKPIHIKELTDALRNVFQGKKMPDGRMGCERGCTVS